MAVRDYRRKYSGSWDDSDRRRARDLADDVGIKGKGGKYAAAWDRDDREALSRIAEDAGVSGSEGKYARCMTRENGKVVMDTECLRDAAENSGLAGSYFSEWS